MKTTLAILLIVLLGVGAGVGSAYLRIGSARWTPNLDDRKPAARPDGPAPKVVVKETKFEFGTLDIAGKGSHDFVIANAGEGVLELTSGPTSCRCTMSKLEHEKIPPGGSAKVAISWTPTDQTGPYEQTATILTNDPEQPRITLSISGTITATLQLVPPELVFSRLSNNETAKAQALLLCYLDAPLEITGHEWSDPGTAKFFEAALEPLSADEVKKIQPLAKNGQRITVRVKPGLPQGAIHQRLILNTNVATLPTMTLPIHGTISSEVSIVGPGWNADAGVVDLGEIAGSEGAQRRLLLIVRGDSRRDTTFKIVRVEPDVLKVSLGKPSEINNGVVVQTPLAIAVPPGSRPVNRIGVEPSQQGRIVLETTHPQLRELQILVRFAVVN